MFLCRLGPLPPLVQLFLQGIRFGTVALSVSPAQLLEPPLQGTFQGKRFSKTANEIMAPQLEFHNGSP